MVLERPARVDLLGADGGLARHRGDEPLEAAGQARRSVGGGARRSVGGGATRARPRPGRAQQPPNGSCSGRLRRDAASGAAPASAATPPARGDQVEPAAQVRLAGRAPAHLAARGLGQGRRLDQGEGVELDLVILGQDPAHGAGDRRRVVAQPVPAQLLDQHQPLLAVRLDAERRAAAGPQRRMGALGGRLQVLGVAVAAAEDDQVLDPAGDEQLAVVEEAQVARAQVGPVARPGQPGAEGLGGRLGPCPSSRRRRSARRSRSPPPPPRRRARRVSGSTTSIRCPPGERPLATSTRMRSASSGPRLSARTARWASARRRGTAPPRAPSPRPPPVTSRVPRPGRSRGRTRGGRSRTARTPWRSAPASPPGPARRR